MNSVVVSAELLKDTWMTGTPQHLVWWLDLVLLSSERDGDMRFVCSRYVKSDKGCLPFTRDGLASRWKVSRGVVYNYIKGLEKRGYIELSSEPKLSQLTICNYDSYTMQRAKTNPKSKTSRANQSADSKIVTDTLEPNSLKKCEKNKELSQTQANQLTDNEVVEICLEPNSSQSTDLREKEIREKESSPIPLYKEKENKEKEATLSSDNVRLSNDNTLSPCVREDKPKKSKAKKPEEYTIVQRARLLFEGVYREMYESEYYWQAKDAKAMKDLLMKIAYSRKSKNPPLPIDDDSMLEALKLFLSSINKDWIMNNFSMPKISSQYNDIIAEIKRRRYAKQNEESGESVLSNQAKDVLTDIQKADLRYYQRRKGE